MRISVVMPVYNEAESILILIDELTEVLGELKLNYEIIAVNDGSKDNSFEILKELAVRNHNIKLIYDASHVFGVKYKGNSILNYGDISTLSFHATKIFSTGEGGAIIVKNKKLYEKLKLLRNFGIKIGARATTSPV